MIVAYHDGGTDRFSSDRTLGESDNPLSDQMLRNKFVELSGAVWGNSAEAAWDDMMDIDQVPDVGLMIDRWRTAIELE